MESAQHTQHTTAQRNTSQHSTAHQRTVEERLARGQRRAQQAGAQVVEALARQVLDAAVVEVVEERVDGEVAGLLLCVVGCWFVVGCLGEGDRCSLSVCLQVGCACRRGVRARQLTARRAAHAAQQRPQQPNKRTGAARPAPACQTPAWGCGCRRRTTLTAG